MRVLSTIGSNFAHLRAIIVPVFVMAAANLLPPPEIDPARFLHESQDKAFADAVSMGIERVC